MNDQLNFCEACRYGKSHSLPFNISDSRAKGLLDLIHTNIWGPALIMSNTNLRYCIHFLDDHTRFTWISLESKVWCLKQIYSIHPIWQHKTRLQSPCRRGGQYDPLLPFLHQQGIQCRLSYPHTSTQNGRAERKDRHVTEMGLTLLAQAGMPLRYWIDGFQSVVYLINRLPTPVLKGKSPFE